MHPTAKVDNPFFILNIKKHNSGFETSKWNNWSRSNISGVNKFGFKVNFIFLLSSFFYLTPCNFINRFAVLCKNECFLKN